MINTRLNDNMELIKLLLALEKDAEQPTYTTVIRQTEVIIDRDVLYTLLREVYAGRGGKFFLDRISNDRP